MIDDFDETRPEFRGFSDYYRSAIFEGLLALDMQRRATVKVFITWVGFGVILGLIGFGVSMIFGLFGVGVFAGFAGFVLGMSQAEKRMKVVRLETKAHLVGGICQYVGMSFKADGFEPMKLNSFQNLSLLPKADRKRFEDQITGLAWRTFYAS